MADHKVDSQKMICQGFALGVVNDLQPKAKFNFLQNIRVILEGELRSRPKVDSFATLSPITTDVPYIIKTILNKGDNTFNRIVGAGSALFTGNSDPLIRRRNDLSTVPFTIVDFRPEEATEAYAYIADKLALMKISVSDLLSEIGLNPPIKPLTFSIAKANRKIIDNITTADIGTWNNLTGSAQTPTAIARINTTNAKYLPDSIEPCYASMVPTNQTIDIQSGCILIIDVDEVIVEEVCPATLKSGTATISKISYDTGATGLATIVLSTSDVDLKRNSIVKLNNTEYVRVLEVTRDLNNIPSIRVSTVGTFSATQTVVGFASFRFYSTLAYSPLDTIFAEALETQLTASGVSSITKTVNIDLTTANNKPLTDDDIFHISIQPADPSLMTEIQIQLGYNSTFDEDYLYFAITPNFFQSSALQTNSTLVTIQEAVQRRELLSRLLTKTEQDNQIYGDVNTFSPHQLFDSPISQTALGENQWTEFFIRIGDFIRSGTNSSLTKRNITHVRISINCTAATFVRADSIWIGGGSTLDTKGDAKFLKYNYIWRVRDNITKNPSNWSPPLREGIETNRTNIQVTPPINAFSANFLLDIARFGGTLNDWRVIGSIKNDGSSFIDTVSDRTAAQNDKATRVSADGKDAFDYYKPFTYLDTPKRGTCDVVGTKWIWKTGDKLNITYPRGVEIFINGIRNQFYVNPTDDSHVELENDMGSLTDVQFEIVKPLLTGQAIPIIFGPWGEGSSGLIIFGVKAIDGLVLWLDGNSPDTMSDLNFLEITSPSEPILTGVIYDGLPIVYTTRRSFTLYPTYQTGSLNFIARENANSRGVLGSYCICVGRDYIYQVSENGDGIYRSQGGGNPQSITDGSLYNLFMHNGVNPTPITLIDGTIVYPPDFTFPNSIRLFYCRDIVIFRFINTNAEEVAIIFDERINDWLSFDKYLNNKINAFYQEELPNSSSTLVGIEGAIGKFGNLTTREDALLSIILPFASDQGDSNLLKQYDEIVIDINKGVEVDGFNYKNYYNNGLLSDILVNIAGALSATRNKIVKTINKLARNITTEFSWTLKSGVKLYEEQIYFLPQADLIENRPGDVNDGGFFGEKFWQGVIIEADTFGVDKKLQIYADDDLVNPAAEITINHTGKQTLAYSFDLPFIAHTVIRKSTDLVDWIFYREEYKVDKEPEKALVWEGQETTFDIPGYKIIKRQAIAYRATKKIILTWTYDNDEDEVYELPSTGGLRGKFFFFLNPRKGKVLRSRLESEEPFRLYRKDCEAWIRGFNSQEDYQTILPMGDDSRVTEIRI